MEVVANCNHLSTQKFSRPCAPYMERFPDDFMFELTKKEFENLRCRFGTLRSVGFAEGEVHDR
ncbi:MAG: ORF6N domain-containing protein [Thermodesulfobacteriota bacterium]|nr:ORF6N domain-containing protein [Thermodesulfobacteriota bacterium]